MAIFFLTEDPALSTVNMNKIKNALIKNKNPVKKYKNCPTVFLVKEYKKGVFFIMLGVFFVLVSAFLI